MMARHTAWTVAVSATLAFLTACGQDASQTVPADTGAAPTSGSPSTPEQDEPIVSEVPIPAGQEQQVREAIADLAQRKGLNPSQIRLVELSDVTWADGSLGCPQPGMMYTQALVAGHRLLLAVDTDGRSTVFAYHAGRTGAFRFCETPEPPSSAEPGSGDR